MSVCVSAPHNSEILANGSQSARFFCTEKENQFEKKEENRINAVYTQHRAVQPPPSPSSSLTSLYFPDEQFSNLLFCKMDFLFVHRSRRGPTNLFNFQYIKKTDLTRWCASVRARAHKERGSNKQDETTFHGRAKVNFLLDIHHGLPCKLPTTNNKYLYRCLNARGRGISFFIQSCPRRMFLMKFSTWWQISIWCQMPYRSRLPNFSNLNIRGSCRATLHYSRAHCLFVEGCALVASYNQSCWKWQKKRRKKGLMPLIVVDDVRCTWAVWTQCSIRLYRSSDTDTGIGIRGNNENKTQTSSTLYSGFESKPMHL